MSRTRTARQSIVVGSLTMTRPTVDQIAEAVEAELHEDPSTSQRMRYLADSVRLRLFPALDHFAQALTDALGTERADEIIRRQREAREASRELCSDSRVRSGITKAVERRKVRADGRGRWIATTPEAEQAKLDEKAARRRRRDEAGEIAEALRARGFADARQNGEEVILSIEEVRALCDRAGVELPE